MDEGRTGAMVYDALFAGFPGVDTANHYRNGKGIALAISDGAYVSHCTACRRHCKHCAQVSMRACAEPLTGATCCIHSADQRICGPGVAADED